MTDDLLAALLAAAQQPEDDARWLTAREIRERLHMSENALYTRLQALAAEGRLEVRQVRRVRLDGRTAVVPGYRVRSDAPM